MRVGLDFRIVKYTRAGFYRYAQGLIASLERFPRQGARFFLLHDPDDDSFARLPDCIERVPVSAPLFDDAEENRLRSEIENLRLDVIHFPFSLFPGRLAPRVLLTIHDLTCSRFPETIEGRYLPYYRAALERAASADRIVAVSRRVAADLVAAGAPPDQVHLCYQATPFDDATPAPAGAIDTALLRRLDAHPYILSVGSLEPRKNHIAALDAFGEIRRRGNGPLRLVLVGGHGWLAETFFAELARHPHRDDVLLVQDATDATLQCLLRGCDLFLNLSTYEGFGLPVLEALAADACVLSTPVPSLEEGGFPCDGILDSVDAPAVATRAVRLLGDTAARRSLARRGRAAVETFYRSCEPARLARLYDS